MTDDVLQQQRRSWRRDLKVTVTLMNGIAILWGINSLAEAASQCSVGGSKQTHATIQAAVDDPVCAKVKVAAGLWEPFTVTRSVQVRGANGAIVQPASSGASDTAPNHGIIVITGATTVATVQGLTVQGPVNAGVAELVGIFVGEGATATITKNSILNIREDATGGFGAHEGFHAIRIGASDDATSTGIATISNNTITGYQKSGILIQNVGSKATVTKNMITGDARTSAAVPSPYGVEVDRKALATLSKNTISGNTNPTNSAAPGAGILLAGAGNNINVSGNKVTSNDAGICLKRTNKATIEKNKVSFNSDGIVLDNQIDTSDQPFATTTTNDNVVTRNTVNDNSGIGIEVLSANNNTFERNKVDNNDAEGIFVSCDDVGAGCAVQPFGPPSFAQDNTFARNTSSSNALQGVHDESGASAAAVTNHYDRNKCKNNEGGASAPDGLCQ